MRIAKARLVLAAALFAGWLGYLAYLTTTLTRPPLVLSRPQFLISNLDVIARVEEGNGPNSRVQVEEVLWPRTPEAQRLQGQAITIANLAGSEGWAGAGSYILALTSDGKDSYQVAPTPPSPGYEPNPATKAGRPHIYPATAAARAQLETIRKPETLTLPPL
jgi:hypothetical protein